MEIKRTQKEEQTSLISVKVGEKDYGEAVEKSLRDYRRKANIPGFRPGMVPMGIIKKMYGKGVVAEQSYRTASNAVFEYLQKENIDYLGDVIPAEEQGAFDFDNDTEFEYMFEIGEAPKIDLALSAKDKVTYHRIKIDKQMHDNYRSNFLRRYGRLVDVEKGADDEALTVTLDIGELRVEDAYVGLISMNDEERKPFKGKKDGAKMKDDINELYKNPAQRAAALQLKENELAEVKPEFSLEITKIRKFADPELNEEFFKTAFPQGNVTDEAGLDAFVDTEIGKELSRESDYLFTLQLRDFLLIKADLKMPAAFLKRWLYVINEEKFSKEEIEKDFDQFLKMFSWNYIQKHFRHSPLFYYKIFILICCLWHPAFPSTFTAPCKSLPLQPLYPDIIRKLALPCYRYFVNISMLLLLLCRSLRKCDPFQICINKDINGTIHNCIYISGFFIGTVIFDHGIWLHNVGTDLVAPADIRYFTSDSGKLGFCFLLFQKI